MFFQNNAENFWLKCTSRLRAQHFLTGDCLQKSRMLSSKKRNETFLIQNRNRHFKDYLIYRSAGTPPPVATLFRDEVPQIQDGMSSGLRTKINLVPEPSKLSGISSLKSFKETGSYLVSPFRHHRLFLVIWFQFY